MGNTHFKAPFKFLKLKKGNSLRLPPDYIEENLLGEGYFGQVIRCRKVSTNEIVAVKMIKKEKGIAAREEIRAMKYLSQLDCDKYNLVKFYEHFRYNGTHCLAFENLHLNLFDYMEERNFDSLPVYKISFIAQQLLVALDGLKSLNLVHCDIKPDNIVLVDKSSLKIKLIDFGLVCKTSELEQGWVVQVPSYRALEVLLGLPFGEAIDMWSVGCSLAFLFLGDHLFPEDKQDVMRRIVDLFGKPDNDLLNKGLFTNSFFTCVQTDPVVWELNPLDEQNKSWSCTNCFPNHLEMSSVLAFLDLLRKMLTFDPKKRITPTEALGHTFITMKHLMTASDLQSAVEPNNGGTLDEASIHSSKGTLTETEKMNSECNKKVRAAAIPSTYIKSVHNTSNIVHMKPLRPKSSTTNSESQGKAAVGPTSVDFLGKIKIPPQSTSLEKATATNIIKQPLATFNIIHVKLLKPKSSTESSCPTSGNPPFSFSQAIKAKTFTLQKSITIPTPQAVKVDGQRSSASCSKDSSCSSENSGFSKATEVTAWKTTWKRIKTFFSRICRSILN